MPDLEWVKVSYRSPHGDINSSWKREDGVIYWSVTVPENTTAEVQLNAYTNTQIKLNQQIVENNSITLQAGEHLITIKE